MCVDTTAGRWDARALDMGAVAYNELTRLVATRYVGFTLPLVAHRKKHGLHPSQKGAFCLREKGETPGVSV